MHRLIPCSSAALVLALSLGTAQASDEPAPAQPAAKPPSTQQQARKPQRLSPNAPHKIDRSGQRQVGKASFYGREFYGRKMANGKPMHPQDDNAASRTLPLGTVARVTNLENGQSTVVTIEDRGPYVAGRIVDLSPGSAREIGLSNRQGIAPVEVVPLQVPPPAGSQSAAADPAQQAQ